VKNIGIYKYKLKTMPANLKAAGISYGKGGTTKAKCGGHAIKTGNYKCGGPVKQIINGSSLRPK
jgi:hypothetical protein